MLEIFGEGNRILVLPVWSEGWMAAEVGEAGWSGAMARRAEMMPKSARGDRRPLEELAMMAQDR